MPNIEHEDDHVDLAGDGDGKTLSSLAKRHLYAHVRKDPTRNPRPVVVRYRSLFNCSTVRFNFRVCIGSFGSTGKAA